MFFAGPFLATVEATYSIAATDLATRQIGGAGASCVPEVSIGDALYQVKPDAGVLLTQATVIAPNSTAVTTALEQMGSVLPLDILNNMNALDNATEISQIFFGTEEYRDFEFRQNAIVDLNGAFAGWTGGAIAPLYEAYDLPGTTQEHAGDVVENGRYSYSAQGNVVTNMTVPAMQEGFEGEGCDLAERLMNAMLAVSSSGAGDDRCIRDDFQPVGISGVPAAGAFVKIQREDGGYVINLDIKGDGSVDPTIELKQQYDAWRANNPCPTDTAPTDSSPTDSSPTDAPPTDPAPTDPPAPTEPAPTEPAPTDAPVPTEAPTSGSFTVTIAFSILATGIAVLCF